MAVANAVELSGYITAMAASARAAQAVMSSGADPMTIREFKFDVSIEAEFSVESETDISLNIWRLNLQEKITVNYRREWSLGIECTIVPSVTLAS